VTAAARNRAAFDPASAPPAAERALTGHSGASVVLHTSGLNSFVRKTAERPEMNTRLTSQAEKQRMLRMLGLPFPRVFMQGEDCLGRASFDMEYIPGRSIAAAVGDAASFDPLLVVTAVERMAWLFSSTAGDDLDAALFVRKIDGIARHGAADPSLAAEIEACARLLGAQDWRGIPASSCHGDLTLENILLKSDRSIVFIDCDETFASSFWLDFAKLFQDISGHWCIRELYAADAPPVHRVNAIQKLDQLGARLRALAAGIDPALAARLPQLASLGLFRAIPYAKDPALVAFLCGRIGCLLGQRP